MILLLKEASINYVSRPGGGGLAKGLCSKVPYGAEGGQNWQNLACAVYGWPQWYNFVIRIHTAHVSNRAYQSYLMGCFFFSKFVYEKFSV